MKAGDQKTFSVIFPKHYNSEKLAGKSAEFEIEVVKVEEPVLPEVDQSSSRPMVSRTAKSIPFAPMLKATWKENWVKA